MKRDRSLKLELPGRWDASRPLFPDLTGVRRLDLDLSQTTYLDAAGFASLVRLIRTVWSWNGQARLLGASGAVLEMLRASRLDQAVEVL